MKHREIVAAFASFALIAAVAGCSTTSTAAKSDTPTATSGVIEQRPTELAGIWRGEFYQVGGDAQLEGQVTLEVKDDGTYTMTARRLGSESGVIESRGDTVTLKSSSGHWTPLRRSGDRLYGMTTHPNGRPIKLVFERKPS